VTPDYERDIVVFEFAAVDALTGEAGGLRWSVWIGRETDGAFESEAGALAHAAELATASGRSAWMVRDGLAPRLIEP
jgi:hypothetical protein